MDMVREPFPQGTWIFFLPSRISHVFATDPCGHRPKLRSGHLTCRDLVHQNMPSPVHSSCTLVTQQILATSFFPVARRNLKVLSQLWPCYVESSTRVTKPFPSTSTWSFHCEKLSLSFAHMSNPQCF